MRKVFKSVWFKCISVLLVIICFAGGLLAVLNDLLYVSPETRTARAMQKIYGEKTEYSTVIDVDSLDENLNSPLSYDFDDKGNKGLINKLYKISNGDYVFLTVGENGFKGGTVSLWIKVVNYNGTFFIDKVILEGYTKQTLMSMLKNSFFERFKLTDVAKEYNDGNLFYAKGESGLLNPVSGATKSATATCNAVNCVIRYLGENQ